MYDEGLLHRAVTVMLSDWLSTYLGEQMWGCDVSHWSHHFNVLRPDKKTTFQTVFDFAHQSFFYNLSCETNRRTAFCFSLFLGLHAFISMIKHRTCKSVQESLSRVIVFMCQQNCIMLWNLLLCDAVNICSRHVWMRWWKMSSCDWSGSNV